MSEFMIAIVKSLKEILVALFNSLYRNNRL